MIWFFFVFFSFLEVVPSGTTQGYFHHVTFNFEVRFQVFVIVNDQLSLKAFIGPMN
jgi:hypothetical protein